jgi:hypothetical protein
MWHDPLMAVNGLVEFARDLEQPIFRIFKLRHPTLARCLLPVLIIQGFT